MAFFGKLFEKKECAICGGEIGLLGNKKLEDGNCCKTCAGKLSPWFDDRRHSTVAQIKQQLAYREENRRNLSTFRPNKIFGEQYELHVEYEGNVPVRFVVARTDDYMQENADLISFRDVTSFHLDISDRKTEQKYRNPEGNMVSYNPPRYEYSYDFYADMKINHPYCDDIRFKLNRNSVELETVAAPTRAFVKGFDPMMYPEYREQKNRWDEVEAVFRAGMQGTAVVSSQDLLSAVSSALVNAVRPNTAAAPVSAATTFAAAPAAQTWRCVSCGTENEGKFCQGCGSPKPVDDGSWICSCGARNTGNFCNQCGSRKPVAAAVFRCNRCGWQPENQSDAPRFCPECGNRF